MALRCSPLARGQASQPTPTPPPTSPEGQPAAAAPPGIVHHRGRWHHTAVTFSSIARCRRCEHAVHGPGEVVLIRGDGRRMVRFDTGETYSYRPTAQHKLKRVGAGDTADKAQAIALRRGSTALRTRTRELELKDREASAAHVSRMLGLDPCDPSPDSMHTAAATVQRMCRKFRTYRDNLSMAVLWVHVSGARGLSNTELLGTSDPYCRFSIAGRYTNVRRRTKLATDTLSPEWKESFQVFVHLEALLQVSFKVYDADLFGDKLMGTTLITLTRAELVAMASADHGAGRFTSEFHEMTGRSRFPEMTEMRRPLMAVRKKAQAVASTRGTRRSAQGRGSVMPAGELTVGFSALLVPAGSEGLIKGHKYQCRLLEPEVEASSGGNAELLEGERGLSRYVGTAALRFKFWDGTHDIDLEDMCWESSGKASSSDVRA